MAHPPPTQTEFRYQTVQLFKAETLGVGSYGAVCKARCDELPCAAKILHPVMFQFNDPGAMAFLRKFEQECQFLRTIKHPNIVQYIATSRDRETGLPVLLMELMDESLTSFLERSQQPLPYHTQVDLCHDIALALAYLHSNGIIHRDLSSNNVLLIAGSRAKVTDFGMSKLIDTNPRMTPLTKCPGTLVYMSPEALRDPPVYSNKLDCFSEGVLIIQMITRKFPNPGPAMRMIEDPRYPVGTVHVAVTETERRKSDIDLIDPAHPLLPLALRCLEYREEVRPSSPELCRCLATFKEAPAYAQSEQLTRERGTQADTEERERQIREQERQLQTNTQQIQTLQQEVQEKDRQLLAKDATIAHKERENRLQLQEKDQLRQETTQQLREKDGVIEERGRQLRELNQQLKTNEQVTAEFQQNLLRKEREVRDLEERLSEKERLVQQLQQLRISDGTRAKHEAAGVARKKTTLKWKTLAIDHSVAYSQPAIDGKTIYFRKVTHVLAYDSETEKMSQLPPCSYDAPALAMVNGLLTAIGGKVTNKLLSFQKGKWVLHFPPMPTKRSLATVLCTGIHLIVAGGNDGINDLNNVEVMNVNTLQWTTASSLPHPVHQVTATLCGDDVYLLGGFTKPDMKNTVLRCSLNALLQSGASHKVWQRVADLPVHYSACATLDGRLLAIGGKDSSDSKTTAVHEYNPATNSWEVVSHTPIPCSSSAVAVLPGNRLIVGIYRSKTMFIGTLE